MSINVHFLPKSVIPCIFLSCESILLLPQLMVVKAVRGIARRETHLPANYCVNQRLSVFQAKKTEFFLKGPSN